MAGDEESHGWGANESSHFRWPVVSFLGLVRTTLQKFGESSHDLVFVSTHRVQQPCVVVQGCAQVGVLVSGAACERTEDSDHSPHEGFGFLETVGGLEQLGEVVQIGGDVGVVGSVGGFVDVSRTDS